MNFEMSDDRRMLADTLRRALSDGYGFEHRTRVAYEPPFHDPAGWTALTELGVLYAFAGEDAGGMGGSGFDVAVVFEELGRALCPEPLLPALMAIRAGVTGEDVLSGATRYAVAFGETDAPYELDGIATEARRPPEGWPFGPEIRGLRRGRRRPAPRPRAAPEGPGLFDIAASMPRSRPTA
jgi:alkylation response protein AidB-like acyl-CoA dehydrogenase